MKNNKSKDKSSCSILKYGREIKCDNYELRNDLMQKIIDGQANKEELDLYNTMMSECSDCICHKYCQEELAIKKLLQSKLDRKTVPLELVEKIKTAINKLT